MKRLFILAIITTVSPLVIAELIFDIPPLTIFTQWWYWLIVLIFAVIGGMTGRLVLNRPKPPKTQLQEREILIKQFYGSHILPGKDKAKTVVSSGRWYITSQRLIYEGQIEEIGFLTKTKPDVLIFPLKTLKDIRISKHKPKGFVVGFKVVIATFKKDGEDYSIYVDVRKKEDFREMLHKAWESCKDKQKL